MFTVKPIGGCVRIIHDDTPYMLELVSPDEIYVTYKDDFGLWASLNIKPYRSISDACSAIFDKATDDRKEDTAMHRKLDDLCSLSALTDATLCDDLLTYLFNRFCTDLDQYKAFCTVANLDVANRALNDAQFDLLKLLCRLDDETTLHDADVMLHIYLHEYMDGWQY